MVVVEFGEGGFEEEATPVKIYVDGKLLSLGIGDVWEVNACRNWFWRVV